MFGIASLLQRLQTTFLYCASFTSDQALQATFVDTRLSHWKAGLPEAVSDAERVRLAIEYLSEKHNAAGENGLVLLLHVLRDQTPPEDASHFELTQLVNELEQYTPAPDTPQWNAALDRYREWVKRTHGTMRVLGKHEPVSVEGIYTDVYLLEQPAASRYPDLDKSSDRTRGERQDGLKLVMQPGNERLVILGQPGAGKTTFLKHIALQAAKGELGDYVPILVYLREWAADDLLTFLAEPFAECGFADPYNYVERLLQTGHALILLDGLDEMGETERRTMIKALEKFRRRYQNCRILLTCRVAAAPQQLEQFREVEVADFTDTQMWAFVANWFGKDTTKAKEFQEQIRQDKHLRDLGRTPLLLGMLCLVFDEQGAFPQKRADLYRQALDVLLVQWDDSRNIERDAMRRAEIYHELSLGRKYQMFAYIAHATFEQGEILIPKERLERLLTDYLVTIPNAPARIDIDPAILLKAIEAQHGTLVEHAHEVYAFLHPTFQEYYTARYVVAQVENGDVEATPRLLSHAHEDRWCELILLTASMLDEADNFFTHFLASLDALVRDNAELVDSLAWAQRKAAAVNTTYKPAAVRAFYSYVALAFTLARVHRRANFPRFNLDQILKLTDALYHARDHARDLTQFLGLTALSVALDALPFPSGGDPDTWRTYADELQTIVIQHRDLNHDWHFSKAGAGALERYFAAARLLVACLNVATVTDRAAIEDRLLLPPGNTEKA